MLIMLIRRCLRHDDAITATYCLLLITLRYIHATLRFFAASAELLLLSLVTMSPFRYADMLTLFMPLFFAFSMPLLIATFC